MSAAWQCDRCGKVFVGAKPEAEITAHLPTKVPPAPHVYSMGVIGIDWTDNQGNAMELCWPCKVETLTAAVAELTKQYIRD